MEDKVQKSRANAKRLEKNIVSTTTEFCQESSLHGLKNIVHSIKTPVLTRSQRIARHLSLIIWIASITMGVAFGGIMIHLSWDKFQNNPTITTVETNSYPIWNLRFPAITICNINKVYAPAAENFTATLVARGLPEERARSFLSLLRNLVTPETVSDVHQDVFDVLAKMGYTIERVMFELMEPCDILIERCRWLGTWQSCQKFFRVVTSADGFCCAFNYQSPLDPALVDTENDYIQDEPDDPVYRVSGAGRNAGLVVVIRSGNTESISNSHTYYGVGIFVHGSEDFAQHTDLIAYGQPGDDVQIGVVPTITVSEPSVRSLRVSQRGCYFDDEVKLRTPVRYSYKLCIGECVLRAIYDYCGCLPFYYAEVHLRSFDGKSQRQCVLKDVNCLRKYRSVFASLQPDNFNETNGVSCKHCLPSCSTETFTTQTILAHRTGEKILPSLNNPSVNFSNLVTMSVSFKNLECTKYRRDVILTWDALFATFGGIFSLCLGGSIISLIEIVYYFTFQMFFVSSARKQEEQDDTQANTSRTMLFRRTQVADRRNVAEFVRRMHEHVRTNNAGRPYVE